jgi:GST-like protein
MTDLSAFAITRKWPATHPERLQLYSLPTPNGVKVSIALEETGLAYEPHLVRFDTNDQLSPEFLSLNPNNKIPAIIDPDGPGGRPLALFESGAILVYLAEKTGQLMPADAARRYETLQWLMFQMGGIGPMFGQLGFFNKFAGKDYEDKRPRDRYVAACWACWTGISQAVRGSWATTTPSPTSPASRGSTTWSASTRPGRWWASTTSPTSSACWRPSWRGPRCSAGWASPGARRPDQRGARSICQVRVPRRKPRDS